MPEFNIPDMAGLLRLSANDPVVMNFFGATISNIVRDEYYGSIELPDDGVEAVFKEAPWLIPASEVVDPKALHVSAFHLHRAGHDGYSGYSGRLPNGVVLGDSEADVIGKMGSPSATGGGGMSSVLKRPIPRWLKYPIGEAILNFQMSPGGELEMATLFAPDIVATRP